MTTRDNGITLPVYPRITLNTVGVKVTNTDNDYTVKVATTYGPATLSPVNASAGVAEAPSDYTLTTQNANAGFASVGGNLLLSLGVGSVGNPSGNLVIKDTAGNGGAYNKSHLMLGADHLWIDTSGRLRYKTSAPATATDGDIVGYSTNVTSAYNPANLVDGAGVTTTIAVTGAALGDFVLVSFSLDLQGILLTGYVSSAGNVSVRFQNETGGAIDLGAGTIGIRLIKA